MKRLGRAILPLGFLLLQCPFGLAQASHEKLFFLKDTRGRQWCAFKTETASKKASDELQPESAGQFIFSNHRLSEIDWTQDDEAGDSSVNDSYFLDAAGNIMKVSRRINVLAGNRSVFQVFAIRNGKAVKTSENYAALNKAQPSLPPKSVLLPSAPVSTSTRMFPFSTLVESPGLTTGEKTCVPAADGR